MTDKQSHTDASRRDFMKTSAAAAIGASLVGGLTSPQAVHAAGDDTIKVGLIGCGGRGTKAAKQALSTEGPVQLTAMGDAFAYRLGLSHQTLMNQNLGDRLAVPKERQFVGLDAYQKVIDSGVDLVILATPPGFRPQHFEAAVNAGKNVFMEKPVAVDAPGVRRVLAAAQEAKKKKLAVGVGLQRHHKASYLETIKRLQDGAIGDIHTMRAYWNGGGVWLRSRKDSPEEIQTEMQYQVNNWYYFNWLCGDHICEQHIHNLDVCNWLKDAYPVEAQGMGGREVRTGEEYGEIFDHHAVEYTYADGSKMFSFCRHIPGCWNEVSEHAQGSKGTADISAAKIQIAGQEDAWRYRGENKDPYQQEHDDLFASIRRGEPLNEAEFGAKSSMTSILGRMATYSGKIVTWEDAIKSQINLGPEEGFTWDTTPPTPHIAVPGKTEVV